MLNEKERTVGPVRMETLAKISGILLIAGGLLYILIQFIHPSEDLGSVSTDMWVVVAVLSMLMSLVMFIGIIGIYLIQSRNMGIVGLIGLSLFGIFWLISFAFGFVEAFVLPLLVNDAPEFVAGMAGLFGESEATADLGIFPNLAAISGGFYILGGILYGIAGFRAKVLSKYAFLFLTAAAVATVLTGIIPYPYNRPFAFPMGLAMIWIGYDAIKKNPLFRQN